MTLVNSVLLLGGLLASQSLAQNATAPVPVGGNITEVIANATEFSFPEMNLTTVTIEYHPPPIFVNGSHGSIAQAPVRERVSYFKLGDLAIVDGDVIFGTEAELLAHVVPEATAGNPVPVRRDINSPGHHVRMPPPARRALSLSRDDPRKWAGGAVKYYWESQATKDARQELFLKAAKVWTDRLPFLSFQDMGIKSTTTVGGPIILTLSDKSVSSSPLGMAQSADGNKMVLGRTSNVGIYVHEIGHSKSSH